ncbi:hypothetical protein HYY70_02355 [Candidatus Woesearchaeota archaeon]|nr:hypothetical protein [Candidatus Woesearchaeota archaeon]
MRSIISEGSAKLKIPKTKKISKEMRVFYNPAMSLNRDISVLLLNSIDKTDLQIADPLAATGVRSIRFLKELNKNKIKRICINDYDKSAVSLIKENLELNKIKYDQNNNIIIQNLDANIFLLHSMGLDYIDIDPFGTPNLFLDAACKRLSRDGILAVTATDTSALCGTFPKACMRKYWAMPRRDSLMHETGLRILIRKVQLIAAQFSRAFIPIFSYSKEHYMRIFLKNYKGKNKSDETLKSHGYFNNAGPMWLGNLWDKHLTSRIYVNALKNKFFKNNKELTRFLKIIRDESKIDAVGFYDLSDICRKNKLKHLQKKEFVISKIRKLGYQASETHFKGEGIRSDMPLAKLINLMKNK